MTLTPDPDLPAHGGDADAPVQGPSLHGAITGHVAVGRYVLHVGEPCGAVVREAAPADRAHIRPRPTPVLHRPKSNRGLFDRRIELAAAVSALDAGLPVEASGAPGIGKTSLLRHLAHHPRAAAFADGIVYVSARYQSPDDLLQRIFEAFYESDGLCKPTEAEIRSGLREQQALILLDDVDLTQDGLERVLDIAPRSAFVVATGERHLWREVRSLALNGLPVDDAVLLLEREIERPLDDLERSAATDLCAALGGHPLRILQAAAIIRERGISPDGWARDITPESLIDELVASIDEKPRRALLALTALPGVPLEGQHVAGIAEVTDIEPALTTLVRRGLIASGQSRYRIADGVADRLRRAQDLKPWVNRAITYFTGWAERNRRSPDDLLTESDALLRVQEHATDARRWGEVLLIGRLLEGALVVGARWGAWAITLERCLAAAKAIGDRSAEAWALHESGTRAVCLGEPGGARALLSQAVKLREALDDQDAAEVSRRNLSFVLRPISDEARERPTMPFDDVPGLESLPVRDVSAAAVQVPKTRRVAAALLTMVLFAMLGALGYSAARAALSSRSWSTAGIGSFLRGAMAGDATTPPPLRAGKVQPEEPGAVRLHSEFELPPADPGPASAPLAPATDPVSIRIFTPRPGSISTGGPTELCYAVSGAVHARVHPGVGEVNPTSTLTCLRVAPIRTTTYQLTAYGRDGDEVRQQLVIVVR